MPECTAVGYSSVLSLWVKPGPSGDHPLYSQITYTFSGTWLADNFSTSANRLSANRHKNSGS